MSLALTESERGWIARQQRLVLAERETYESAWALPAYAEYSPGETYLPLFLEMAKPSPSGSVVDAGCGAGKGALALKAAGFNRVTLCDLTAAGLLPEVAGWPFVETALWSDLTRTVGVHDWVYCCDVLEHVPPTFTLLVVSRLLAVAHLGVFLSIALVPDQFGPWVGTTSLHQTLQSFTDWRDQLGEVGEVVESRDFLNVGIYLLRPRC